MSEPQQPAEQSTPETAFGEAMDALDPPLIVVTAADGRDRDGCVVGFHSQCSLEPLRYALWLSRANRTYRVALRSEYLGVHFLGAGDHDLGEWFGGHTGDEEDPFAGVEVQVGPGGVPLVRDVPGRFVGRRVAVYDDDECDHVCFVVEPCADHVSGSGMKDQGIEDDQLRVSGLSDVEPGHPG